MILIALPMTLLVLIAPQEGPPPAHPLEEVVVEAAPPAEGEVALNCEVVRGGRLADCRVVSEEPAGYGMAEAALRSARNARLSARRTQEGKRVDFTIRFRLDD